jgi:predicted negative regulator of RcsB-dependent stress response
MFHAGKSIGRSSQSYAASDRAGQFRKREAIRHRRRLVVGVILNLAVFFGYHVWWSNSFANKFDWMKT